ncbi:hypothetical protein [Streptomyces purpurogeneiscleroticus]|uniref:hypothetical protein n=1 Tax=Streptomyces purpurogeneiscleroticus TaxID=68259 RepID=UPI001CC09E87|nr:hypothetical protein [Streptomyces purpurogeneiscleroticus]MBZ4014420.1 hypothetical protein [Streptomyces purpurogeneiscleroticus]
MTYRNHRRAAVVAALATALTGLAPQAAQAADTPAPPKEPTAASVAAARDAASAPGTLKTLARFFARDGRVSVKAAAPRIEGATVPVHVLSPDFVRGRSGAPVAKLDFLASRAVSADGQEASVWTVRTAGADTWRVVNIATGADETAYAAKAKGGTLFREPQIDAWYVQRGDRVLPLDADAKRAVGASGTTVAAYQKRVHAAYGDKLPGSAYDRRGEAGGYGERAASGPAVRKDAPEPVAAAAPDDSGPLVAVLTALGTVAALALGGTVMGRKLRRR